MALPCTVLPCTEPSHVPEFYRGVQLAVPSHRRELQTAVSTVAGLTSALANTAVGRIVLASGTYYLTAELSVTRSVTLEAAAGATVILNAQASSSSPRRVLHINLGSSGVVQLIGLRITGGYTTSHGGGVFVQGGTVTFSSCTINGNSLNAYGSFGVGGGVFVQGGTVTLSSCTINGNTAYSATGGGGIAVLGGTVTISSCTISGNTVTYAWWGGGVYVYGGTVSIVNSQIYSNFAPTAGGVYAQGGTVAISSCTISGNTDEGSSGPNVYVNTGGT
eukprot:jgi/Chrpa1/18447/Chrysochromulina_OHIO_Genome00024317-RA